MGRRCCVRGPFFAEKSIANKDQTDDGAKNQDRGNESEIAQNHSDPVLAFRQPANESVHGMDLVGQSVNYRQLRTIYRHWLHSSCRFLRHRRSQGLVLCRMSLAGCVILCKVADELDAMRTPLTRGRNEVWFSFNMRECHQIL